MDYDRQIRSCPTRDANDPAGPGSTARAVVDAAQEGMALFRGSEFLYANDAFHDALGVKRSEGGEPFAALPGAVRDAFLRAIAAAATAEASQDADQDSVQGASNTACEGRLRIRGSSASAPELFFKAVPLASASREKGESGLILLTLGDHRAWTTAQRDADLRHEHFLEALLESSPALVAFLDSDGRLQRVNGRLASEAGLTPSMLMGAPAFEERHYGLRFSRAAFERALGGEKVHFQSVFTNAQGRQITVECHYRPRILEGQVECVFVIAFDVSDRVRAVKTMRESRERLRKLVEIIPYGICRTSISGRILFANPAYGRILGYTPEELIGREAWDLYPPEERESHRKMSRAVIRDRPTPTTVFARCQRSDGVIIHAKFDWTYEYDGEGALVGFLSIMSDVTDQMKAEQALRESKEIAERASQEKSRFLAATSHDLQQPLHSLSIMLGLLREQQDDSRRDEILGTMERALRGAQGLLRAVLDLSKLEAGVVVPRVESFRLNDLFTQIEAELGPQATVKPLQLRVVPSSRVIRSDRLLLKSIMYNLVSNAIRYTSEGRVLLGARLAGDHLRIEVWDTGAGIPRSQQGNIFREFTRLEQGQVEGGTHSLGLGLSIVERTCRLLGHDLDLRSELGHGSVFTVSVPLSSEPAVAPAEPYIGTGYGGQGLVLLVEDNKEQAEGLNALLRQWGYDCRIAHDLASARAVMEKGQSPDLLLVDYNLGRSETGLDVVDAFRAEHGRTIPGILSTGERQGAAWEEAHQRGVLVIAKPVNPARLRALVAFLIQDARRGRDRWTPLINR